MGHVHPEAMRELEQELTEARQGILECQTRILALERELAEAKTALDEACRQRDEERITAESFQKEAATAIKDRDEAHAAIRALKGKAIHLDNGYRYCVLCNSAPAHRAEDVQHNPQCPIPKHAPVIRRAMGEGK